MESLLLVLLDDLFTKTASSVVDDGKEIREKDNLAEGSL